MAQWTKEWCPHQAALEASLKWGAKDKGTKSAWLEGARMKKLQGKLGWGEIRATCCR